MSVSRREFLQSSGVGLLTFCVAGCNVALTPEQAKQQGAEFRVLQPSQVAALEALANVLLPGSAEKGLAHFIDQQLNTAIEDQLLMIKYLGVEPPFDGFYLGGLSALDATSEKQHDAPYAELTVSQQTTLLTQMTQSNPDGWQGPPAPFFYFVLRNDAIDVVYGTPAGFADLGVPYMPHIDPPDGWQL